MAKTILAKTGIDGFDYCINPYVGCEHGCRYCYATFMKRFTGHVEPWGEFVDVKVNAASVLIRQLKRAKPGSLLIGTVTDPYQPLEERYELTRGCLEALAHTRFSVNILTRSPRCLRDIDLFRKIRSLQVGLSITTHDEEIKKLFEPSSPAIHRRIEALKTLRGAGVGTYAFVGPMLPLDPLLLAGMLDGVVSEVLIDKLNYPNKVAALYRKAGLGRYLDHDYFVDTAMVLQEECKKRNINVSLLF